MKKKKYAIMENINQHLQENQDSNSTPSHSEQEEAENGNKRPMLDENGQKINWDDPEISEADNTQGRNPKIRHPKKWHDYEDGKEIPEDEE